MISAALLSITSFFLKLIISVVCSLEDSQSFFMQFLPLYTSCLFSMVLNVNISDIKKPNGTSLLTFVVDKVSELFLYPSVFSIKNS